LRTTTSTPITVNTYSDGTVSSVEGTSSITKEEYSLVYLTEQKDNFSGRIDQHDKLASLNLGIDRSLNMDVFRQDGICLNKNAKDCANSFRLFVNGSATNASLYDEYSATSKTYGIGTDYSINEDWRIGAQVNRVNTKMTGVDSLTHQDKTHYGIFSSYSLANFILVSNFGYAQNHVNSNRNIQGIFENSHSVNGQTVWLQNRLYAPTMQGVKPFVGYTFGRTERNAYMETGSIESSRQVGSIKDNTNYAEAGLRANQAFGKFAINGEASLTSDSFKTLGIRATYTVFKDTDISFGVSRQIGDGLASNAVSLRAGVRF
jgi:hypothetical protein